MNTMTNRIRGVLAPVVTPFDRQGAIRTKLFVEQCQWLQDRNISLAVFGTNSEANSLSADEKLGLLDSLVEAGIDMSRVMPGTGACDLPTAVRLSRKAVEAGCAGVLTLPPFFYKSVSDDGLFNFFARLIEQVADSRLKIYLYHIPPVAQVGFSLALIERLLKAYPGSIAGMKDSSGDWNGTQAILKEFSAAGFDVFAGNEIFLLDTMRNGGAGCISATANTNADAIHHLYQRWREPGAEALQQHLNEIRGIFQAYPMIPALKSALHHWSGEDDWKQVRAPLVELTSQQNRELIERLKLFGFSIPALNGERRENRDW